MQAEYNQQHTEDEQKSSHGGLPKRRRRQAYHSGPQVKVHRLVPSDDSLRFGALVRNGKVSLRLAAVLYPFSDMDVENVK